MADTDMLDNYGWTALMYAAVDGQNEAVTSLLSHKAPVDIAWAERKTAVMYEASHGHNEVAATLIGSEGRKTVRETLVEELRS